MVITLFVMNCTKLVFQYAHQMEDNLQDLASSKRFVYNFHLSMNDVHHFPYQEWKRLYNQVFREEYKELLFYGDPQGEIGLRKEITTYLYQFRKVVCTPEQIVIGAEQHVLMNLLALILKPQYTSIAAENPGYRLIPATFSSVGYEVIPIGLDKYGINMGQLKQSKARIVTVTPSHQFPSGIVMPISRRLELLQWAKENDSYIIEDDYGGEYRYQNKPVPSLQGLVSSGHVIYLGGFSQVLAPDLCIHYMVLPEPLLGRFKEIRRDIMFDPSSSRINQRTLQRFMQLGRFERHIRKMRNIYRKKNQQLLFSIKEHFREKATVIGAHAGLHIVLQVRSGANEAELIQLAHHAGILISSAAFYWQPMPESNLKQFMLGFGGIELNDIDEGIRLLHEIWAEVLEEG